MMRQCFISSSRQTQEAAASSTVLLSQEQIHSPVVESKNLTALELAQLDLLRFANEHTNKISSNRPTTANGRLQTVYADHRQNILAALVCAGWAYEKGRTRADCRNRIAFLGISFMPHHLSVKAPESARNQKIQTEHTLTMLKHS
ncbi:hypothetical protein BLNAU_14417 [Blattamonas nauphoetae]|uniref:Uncharacterized protein n=1 Tax=Blattamonas nauphoetae TaxID=2049346 RepID=A0ABQ9XF73_9EUKA|nr:hypothetical protein BLNAU_14417 [Blattamonas nauphoetae]